MLKIVAIWPSAQPTQVQGLKQMKKKKSKEYSI